jgi:hypothetical protein
LDIYEHSNGLDPSPSLDPALSLGFVPDTLHLCCEGVPVLEN